MMQKSKKVSNELSEEFSSDRLQRNHFGSQIHKSLYEVLYDMKFTAKCEDTIPRKKASLKILYNNSFGNSNIW